MREFRAGWSTEVIAGGVCKIELYSVSVYLVKKPCVMMMMGCLSFIDEALGVQCWETLGFMV